MILPAPALMKRSTGKYWDFKKQLAFSFLLLAKKQNIITNS